MSTRPLRRTCARHVAPHPDPVRLRAGESVIPGDASERYPGWVWITTAGGRSGWAPQAWLDITADGRVLVARDYSARELELDDGELVEVLDALAGWLLVEDARGATGWIPEEITEPVR